MPLAFLQGDGRGAAHGKRKRRGTMNPSMLQKKTEQERHYVRRQDLPIPEGTIAPLRERTPIGLCATCTKLRSCTFPRNQETPVRHCEEFEGETLSSADAVLPAPSPAETSPSLLRGLCRICAHAETCTFPKAESGVWFCEEFE
jgi:hypothetical protein